jgi:hypothetical protein
LQLTHEGPTTNGNGTPEVGGHRPPLQEINTA